ncbi:hypothetical protein ACP4OV_029204 [Aristida adscensionis]
MELALGAVSGLAPKLAELLKDEYVKRKGLRPDIESLSRELVIIHAALVDVSKVPWHKLQEVDKVWARQLRELSYDMEDAIDVFVLRTARRELAADDVNIFKKIGRKAVDIAKNLKGHHQIIDKVKDIKNLSKELADMCAKYRFKNTTINPTASTSIDPRVLNMYKSEAELVGIEDARDEVIRRLTDGGSDRSLKIVSIVGFGGLGKTTLAKTVYDRLKAQFDCSAFVPVGRNPILTTVLKKLLVKLDEKGYKYVNTEGWDDEQFSMSYIKSSRIREFFIVIDDIWDTNSWKRILYSLKDSKCGSRLIMTTRNSDMVNKGEDVYRVKPLSLQSSQILFNKRISSGEEECLVNKSDELHHKILKKCGGVPLAIIAIASLLADKPWKEWSEVYDSMVSGHGDSTMEIISYSYEDLPSHLKPCLLYFNAFPEDYSVTKNSLIWMWIGEGFIQVKKEEENIFEQGERYFNELLNRSMIQPIEDEVDCSIHACCVHDIVLDFIRDLSRRENFITISIREQYASSKCLGWKKTSLPRSDWKVRRLSLQSCQFEHIPHDTLSMPDVVRSLYIVYSAIDEMPQLHCLQVCRLLSIEHSNIPNLRQLGKLMHLRYFEINDTYFYKLPEEIEALKSLQTLIFIDIGQHELPSAFCGLTQLMCMHITGFTRLPTNKMGNLVSLEELCLDPIVSKSEIDDFVVQMGKLTRLRVVHIKFSEELEESSQNALVKSLCSLGKVQDLKLSFPTYMKACAAWEGWEPPRQLWRLSIPHIIFSRLPAWISPLHLPRLNSLDVFARVVEEQDLENLARLPELCYLRLIGSSIHQGYTIDATGGFKKLRRCIAGTMFKFQPGAMPSIGALDFDVIVACRSFTSDGVEYNWLPTKDAISDLDLGLENLLSLEKVTIYVYCENARTSEVEDTVAVLERAVHEHPKHPTLSIQKFLEHLKLDEVFHVSVRELKDCGSELERVPRLQRLECYERLEEVTFHIDCEGASLSEVEQVEAALRQQADIHPKRHKVQFLRENVDKMVSKSEQCNTEGGHDDLVSSTTQPSPTVAREQERSTDTKDKLASLALDQ